MSWTDGGWYERGGQIGEAGPEAVVPLGSRVPLSEIKALGGRLVSASPPAAPEELRAARILWLRGELFEARIQVAGLEAMLRALNAEEL